MAEPGRHLPADSSPGAAPFELVITPESAGWRYSSLRIISLGAGDQVELATAGEEMIIISLSGGCTVRIGDQHCVIEGRANVFAGPSDFAYLPINSQVAIESASGGRFALTGARTDAVLAFRYGPAADVPVELRGAGQASRLVRNFGTVDAFRTGALIACEVITPAGNWSSYPAHKHDQASESESELEEIYYYEIAPGPNHEPGFGYHQTASSEAGEIETLVQVRNADTVLVPYGWHGPCVAAPGFDMYYLNVMAGPPRPDGERAWLISDHPDHAFVRSGWRDDQVDPRLTADFGNTAPEQSRQEDTHG